MAETPQRTRWNDDLDARLATLAASGASLNDAARALRVTKNAVTGRARRKGITFQGDVSAGIRKAKAAAQPEAAQ